MPATANGGKYAPPPFGVIGKNSYLQHLELLVGETNFLSVALPENVLLPLPICHSTTFYDETQKRLNTEPQGVPEALDRCFRQQIARRIV